MFNTIIHGTGGIHSSAVVPHIQAYNKPMLDKSLLSIKTVTESK